MLSRKPRKDRTWTVTKSDDDLMNPIEKVKFWSSRSSFGSGGDCDSLSPTDPYQTDQNRKNNLIHLKSPSATNATEPKIVDETSRRKSADLILHPRAERVNSAAPSDRFSTCLTPTATSFSKDELNEIFNIKRNAMEVDNSPDKSPQKQTSFEFVENLDASMQSTHDTSMHNVALDQSNISLDSGFEHNSPVKTVDSPSVPTETEVNTSLQSASRTSLPPLDLQTISSINEQETETTKTPNDNGQLLNPRSPFTPSPDKNVSFSPVQMVCREIFMTEKSYVNDLQEVIEGYIYHLKPQTDLDVESIFGNLEEIYEFNKEVLYQLEQCEKDGYEIDPIELAKVFCEKARGFNHHYAQYCTNYPEASSFFSIIMQDPGIAQFFLERQKKIGHALSLESYLLKPVQRIMKYHLLFRDILKRYDGDEEGYNTINTAVYAMSDVAEYINEMKRLHENAVKVQEILSKILDLDVPINVFETGRLVLENTFKVHGSRGDRIMYLFEKLLLICKKSEDKLYQFKEKIECSNMMLVESLPKDPLAFQIMRFDNQKVNYTIMAKTVDIKKQWTQHLKRLILENHAAMIPQTARQAILGVEEKAKSKYNSLPIQALDDSVMNNLRNLTKAGIKSPTGKENVALPAGVKRESNEKDSANAPKRSLNVKAKEYLMEKRSRSNLLPHLHHSQPSPEKEKKEKRWKRNKHKRKPSLESELLLNGRTADDAEKEAAEARLKSRSLESLKASIKLQDEEDNDETEESSNILQEIINHNYDKKEEATEKEIEETVKSRPISMVEVEGLTDIVLSGNVEKSVKPTEAEDKSGAQYLRPRRLSKSASLNMHSNGAVKTDNNPKRRSLLSDIDPMELLEKRLSILNDDDAASDSIKNMVRKVSNAFNSSFQAYDDSPRSVVSSEMDISRDLGKILGTPEKPDKTVYRRSTGCMGTTGIKITTSSIARSRSELSVFSEKPTVSAVDIKIEGKPLKETDTMSDNQNVEQTQDENRWSADVDQVFDEVNADLDSIADSIASDTAKSNESEADVGATTATPSNSTTNISTSVGMEINERAALVDARLKEVNVNDMSPNSTRKVNVEVKRVADRIKEYKKLIDAEKQRNSWRRREPKSMNEMIETLDSINTVQNGLSPVYSTHRRRFRSSRNFDNENGRLSSDDSSHGGSVRRSFSENFNPERNTNASLPLKTSVARTSSHSTNLTSVSDSRLSDSSSSLSSGDIKTLKETENVARRTERYKKALKNFDQRATSAATSSSNNHSPRVHRGSDKDDDNDSSDVFDGSDKENRLSPDQWKDKSTSLPSPRRTNAIKRTTRQMSEDLHEQKKDDKPLLCKSMSLNTKEISEEAKPIKRPPPVSKRPPRSSSVPPERRLSSAPTTESVIHEEVSSQYVNQRLTHRAMSETSTSREGRSRGRSDNIKNNNNSKNDNSLSSKYCSLPRSRKKHSTSSSSSNISHRSTSLPRRTVNAPSPTHVDDLKKELDDNHNSILRSPSMRCIQQNHVNYKIKEYFTNLQRSSQISRSRPNLVLVGGSGSSDSDNDTSSNDGRSNSPTNNHVEILRGTVRSMIKRYGQNHYVFDDF
ncbi:uncharacterized protein LOC130641404 isoform X3 [Hydractinia symbiolongicarpus]|nr:uncharacterized protein LOC130641404 isoform X3 [Hydractinia symbiolongicarpus]